MIHWFMKLLFAATCVAPMAMSCATTTTDGSDSESTDGSDSESTVESDLSNCCSSGAFTCPDGTDWLYATPRCGASLKPGARSACHVHCGASCHDSGWMSDC